MTRPEPLPIPDKVFLQWYGVNGEDVYPELDGAFDMADVSWNQERIFDTDIEYTLNEWKPIESAPKDGSEFLAYQEKGELPKFYLCRVAADGRHHNLGANRWAQPTHWIPLPNPPTGVSE